jgi:hypothetical protein
MNPIPPIQPSQFMKKKNKFYKSLHYFSVVLSPEFEEFVKAYAESVHDQWSYAKVNHQKEYLMIFQYNISDRTRLGLW